MNDLEIKLFDYALGNIKASDDLEFQQWLQRDEVQRKLTKIKEDILIFGNNVDPVKPSASLKSKLFQSIDQLEELSPAKKYMKQLSSFFTLPLNRIIDILNELNDFNTPQWETTLIEGAHVLHFDGGGEFAEAHCGLIHLRASTAVGQHKHLGDEYMFILEGSVQTDDGKTYTAGDIVKGPSGTIHSLVAGSEGDCVFAVIAMHGVEFLD